MSSRKQRKQRQLPPMSRWAAFWYWLRFNNRHTAAGPRLSRAAVRNTKRG